MNVKHKKFIYGGVFTVNIIMNFSKLVFEYQNIDDKTAYIYNNENITYGEIKNNTIKLYNFLRQQNISAGQNVVLIGSDSHYFVSMILACWARGIKTYCPSPSFSDTNIKLLCDNLKVKNIFCQSGNKQHLEQNYDQNIFVVEDQIDSQKENDSIEFYQWKDEEIVLHFNTTGSTGVPKLIPHTMKNVLTYAKEWADALEVSQNDIIYCCPKICFNYGFGISLLVTLFKKATALLHTGPTSPKKIKDIFNNHGPTYFFIVPDVAYMLIMKKQEIDFKNVKKIVSAGDFLPPKISNKFENLYNKKILDLIGMAETFGFYTMIDDKNQKSGTVGKPMANVKVKCLDGVIHVKTNYSAKEYLYDTTQTLITFKDGWVKTRDKGHIDANGYLVFEGRIDNLIKIKSKFVSPIEIEDALSYYPNIVSSLIFTRKDINDLPILCANIVCSGEIDVLEVKKFLSKKLEDHKVPKEIFLVKEIKTTYNGKKIRELTN